MVLVESFDPHAIEYTRLALSSKVQIYMMAKIPILVFASPKTGLMNYALKTGFGLTVTEDNAAMLNQAVYKIVNDASLRKNLVNHAYDVALKNHHAAEIRKNLKETLNQICENNESLRL